MKKGVDKQEILLYYSRAVADKQQKTTKRFEKIKKVVDKDKNL